jgi:hypothetical protein
MPNPAVVDTREEEEAVVDMREEEEAVVDMREEEEAVVDINNSQAVIKHHLAVTRHLRVGTRRRVVIVTKLHPIPIPLVLVQPKLRHRKPQVNKVSGGINRKIN